MSDLAQTCPARSLAGVQAPARTPAAKTRRHGTAVIGATIRL